jgi:VCBS repeat protein
MAAAGALCLGACKERPASGPPPTAGPPKSVELPTRAGALHVLADDVDGDGRLDLMFVSHGGSLMVVFYQVSPRKFVPGPELKVTGFHPNDLTRLPGPEHFYLVNAEGDGKLRVLRPRPDGVPVEVAERLQPAPRTATPFTWPGWGLGLAVAPFGGNTLTLLKGFTPLTAGAAQVDQLEVKGEPGHITRADVDGDGIDELLFTTRLTGQVWLMHYPGPGDRPPVPRQVWKFDRNWWPRHVIPIDVNGDGAVDLLVPQSVRQEISVLLNDGHGNFTLGEAIPYPGTAGIHCMAAARDRDGTLYLAAGGVRALTLYRRSAGDKGKFEVQSLPMMTWPDWVVLQDIDGDGWLDLVAATAGAGEPSRVIFGPLWDNFSALLPKGKQQ